MNAVRCLDLQPWEKGSYCIKIAGVNSILPIFMDYDGTDWVWEKTDSKLRDFGMTRDVVYWWPKEE